MALHLRIENETSLPDGGPVSITVSGKRGIDIGRDSHLDWTLPDPTRYISSKHAEIRFREGAYWLHDVSTNGTLLNGGDHRMQAPHRLSNGDRFTIGHYIIAVALDGAQAEPPSAAPVPMPAAAKGYQDPWANPDDIAPPIDRAQLRGPRERPAPVNPDFLDWAADVPDADQINSSPAPRAALRSNNDDMDWAVGPMSSQPSPPPPAPDLPAPRRPDWTPDPDPFRTADRNRQAQVAPQPASIQDLAPKAAAPPTREAPPAAPERIGQSGATDIFLRRLAQAAGVSENVFAQKDAGELADQLGVVMRIVVENVMQLLNARHQAKLLTRSANHTMIQALDNNPLKFSPTADDALRIMFGPSTRSYLDARRAIEQGFEDLKRHQVKTYSAMQHALTALIRDLDPECIDRDTDTDRGIAALMTSRKAKLWDAYALRWQAQMRREGNGPIDRFMLLFSEYYDRDGG